MSDKLFAQCSGLNADGLVNLAQEQGMDPEAFRSCLQANERGIVHSPAFQPSAPP